MNHSRPAPLPRSDWYPCLDHARRRSRWLWSDSTTKSTCECSLPFGVPFSDSSHYSGSTRPITHMSVQFSIWRARSCSTVATYCGWRGTSTSGVTSRASQAPVADLRSSGAADRTQAVRCRFQMALTVCLSTSRRAAGHCGGSLRRQLCAIAACSLCGATAPTMPMHARDDAHVVRPRATHSHCFQALLTDPKPHWSAAMRRILGHDVHQVWTELQRGKYRRFVRAYRVFLQFW
jgi:hypothetical protein